MPSTRSSARGGDTNSSPASVKSTAGNKRKAAAASPESKSNKRGRKDEKQTTIEETIDAGDSKNDDDNEVANEQNANAKPATNGHDGADNSTTNGSSKSTETQEKQNDVKPDDGDENVHDKPSSSEDDKNNNQDVSMTDGPNAFDQIKAQENEAGKTTKEENKESTAAAATSSGDAVQEDKQREEAIPSNILEKGIIYFFTRGRVGTDDPNSVQDLARSYFVLRPLPQGAKLTEGSIQDAKVSRLLALPKKVWPKSGKDRFMVFVEKAKTDMASLKEEFFQGSDYSTKTQGTNHTPAVTPVGEGVYAITTTGGGQGTTHLAYMLTIPSAISDVQKDLGLDEKGSFVLSLKNPEASGPANAQLPQKPDWPKEFIDEFSGRSWMPVQPKHLDYANAQMLLIGEAFENSTEAKPEDERAGGKETPGEELQKLEEEDEHRVEALKGDDSVFVDLGLDSKDYPKVMTTCSRANHRGEGLIHETTTLTSPLIHLPTTISTLQCPFATAVAARKELTSYLPRLAELRTTSAQEIHYLFHSTRGKQVRAIRDIAQRAQPAAGEELCHLHDRRPLGDRFVDHNNITSRTRL